MLRAHRWSSDHHDVPAGEPHPGRTVVIDLSLQGTLSDLVETPTEPTERSTMRSPANGKQGGSHFVTSLVSREAARILCPEKKWRLGRIILLAVEYLPKLKNKRPLLHTFDHSDPLTLSGAAPAHRLGRCILIFVPLPAQFGRACKRIMSIIGNDPSTDISAQQAIGCLCSLCLILDHPNKMETPFNHGANNLEAHMNLPIETVPS